MSRMLALAVAAIWLLSCESVIAQQMGRTSTGTGSSTSSRSGATGTFRPNNSGFGQQSGLGGGQTQGFGGSNTGYLSGASGDPFASARSDPLSIGRASEGGAAGGATQGGRGNTRGRATQQQQRRPQTNFGGGNQNAFNQQNFGRQNNQQARVRSVIRVAFPEATVDRDAVAESVVSSINSETVPSGKNVRVVVNGGVAALTGTVASEYDARFAAALASLEPGVREVRNQLEIVPPEEPATP